MTSPVLQSPLELGGLDPQILLARGTAEVRGQGRSLILSESEVMVSSRPSLRIRFEGSGESNDASLLSEALGDWAAEELVLADGGAQGHFYELGGQLGGDFRKRPYSLAVGGELQDVRGGSAKKLKRVLFHVPNFPDFRGQPITNGEKTWLGRLLLTAGDWQIVLDARPNLAELATETKEQRGVAITHIGELSKGRARFTTQEAEEVLTAVHWFLSFVRGAWTSPMLFYGEGARRPSTWNLWNAGRTDPGSGGFQWCDWTSWAAAQEACEGYFALSALPEWRAGLRVAIGQFISANRPSPVEIAVIAAQLGLELLGWLRLVETGRVKEADWNNHNRYPASRRIRELLALGKVDTSIPSSLSSLVGLDPNWRDGPAVVAGVRNRLVHPRHLGAGVVGWDGGVLADAWLLSSRYLELSLLHALGVRSEIRNRLAESQWTGSTALPPWVITPQ